jgi:arylsulfatase A-like enzyme
MVYRKTIQKAAIFLMISLLAAFSYASETKSPSTKKPSLLLITIDTLRADHLPFYGYKRNTTPFLGRLAEHGILFTNAYSTSSWTVPAITSLATGVYPCSHGVVRGVVNNAQVYEQKPIPRTLSTLAEQLQSLGYRTYAVTANYHLTKELGFGRGFDRYVCVGFCAARKVNKVFLEWKREIELQKGPVFVWLHYFDPHLPYLARQPWLRRYQADKTKKESNIISTTMRPVQLRQLIKSKGYRILTLAQSHYDSEINYCDEQIKKLFQEFPLLEQYTMVFTSDHGEEFLEHGKLTHDRDLYNETVRIPLFIRLPGQACAANSREVVSIIDIAPTLIDIAGGKIPPSWQGRALINKNGQVPFQEGRYVLAHFHRYINLPLNTLIGSSWKFIVNAKTQEQELYNLQNDPGELNNLAKSQPETLKQQSEIFRKLVLSFPPAPITQEKKTLQKEKEEELRSLGYIQ